MFLIMWHIFFLIPNLFSTRGYYHNVITVAYVHRCQESEERLCNFTGTGSGSLSHALIRCIMPHGHLYTFDFHELRVSVVHEEFESHGIGQFVTVEQRDVCQDGFGTELNGKVDAVFLDIPHPWEAVPHAAATFKDVGKWNCAC